MSELPTAMAAALAGSTRVTLFYAVEVQLPGHTARLLDGAAQVTIGGQLYSGRDEVLGTIDSLKGLEDQTGDSAPSLTLVLIPPSNASLGTLLDPSVQGSPVTFMVGLLNPATGIPVSDPYVPMVGELDVPTVTWGDNDRRLEYRITGIQERLFMVEEGRRLSDSFHQYVWPGELGCAFVTGVEETVPWGQALDTTAVDVRSNLPTMAQTTSRT